MNQQLGRRFTCDLCGASLKTRDSPLEHMKIHLNRLEGCSFSCLICGKTFPSNGYLTRHLRNCHGSPSTPQTCRKCGRVFKTVQSLSCHFSRYHSARNTSKIYICQLCGKNYCDTKFLLMHHLDTLHTTCLFHFYRFFFPCIL